MRAKNTSAWLLRRLWCGFREWCGDSAYERYLRFAAKQPGGGHTLTLTAAEFYVEQLNCRYSRPNRCC